MNIKNILSITSLTFLLPTYIGYKSSRINHKIISYITLITTICAQLFWYNAEKYSIAHKIDSYCVRIALLMLVLIIISNVRNIKFIIFSPLIMAIVCIIYSDYFSTLLWCSEKHIFAHALSHMLFTFIVMIILSFN